MKVKLTVNDGIFETDIPDQYYDTIRDLLLVFERHTFKVNEVVE